jgi:formamidopyrimidine-DNA glycosylase
MPELPEVELARGQLERWLKGRTILEATALPGTPLRQTRPEDLSRLKGRKLRRIDRHGKHLSLWFDGDLAVYLHLGMTGKVVRREPGEPAPRFSRVRLRLAKNEVHFCDARRFGRFRLLTHEELRALPELNALGPDAWLALPSSRELGLRLARGRREIKVALLDQTLLAGVGNIHASEALWRARLSPFVRSNALRPAQLSALRKGIRDSLAQALRTLDLVRDGDVRYVEEGAPNPFLVYDRAGEPCRRRDHAPIQRVVQAQRSTFYCPHCQPG